MNKFGKNIIYTNSPAGKDLTTLMSQLKILVTKDYKNERNFKITFGVGTVEIKVYAMLLETLKPSLVETLNLQKGTTIPDLTKLDYYTYVTKN